MLSVEAIGELVGRTASSIQTAASRFGLPHRKHGGNGGEIEPPSTGSQRACVTCSKTFWSGGKHIRMCAKCTAGGEAAAV
jgi:hypothetical protein